MADATALLSADVFKYWTLNYADRTITIVRQDGSSVTEGVPREWSAPDSPVASSTFDWEKWWIHTVTTQGDWIVTEGFNPHAAPPFHGRPSVYLDQNRWRTVTDALIDPDRIVDQDELSAALRLIELASDGGIVLALSGGHMVETGALHSQRRYEVGIAMAKLSAGWQVRHPLDIWQHEADVSMAQHLSADATVSTLEAVTTEPGAMFRPLRQLTDGGTSVRTLRPKVCRPKHSVAS